MDALWLVDANDEPLFQAPIQLLDVLVSDMVCWPESHDSQLAHMTLAVIVSSLTPLPASRVSWAAPALVSSDGWEWPLPRRGDSVRLPVPSWYITNMLDPDMESPVPSATQE